MKLQWDPNTEADIARYRLYYGLASRVYTQSTEVLAPATSAVAEKLLEGQVYYFAVTAINSSGAESAFSQEVSYVVPGSIGTLNAAPTLNSLNDVVLTQNAATSSILLSGITSGGSAESNPLIVTAVSSDPLLLTPPLVFYSSPSTSGQLLFKPLLNTWGRATITVTVDDGQLFNNLATRSFDVIVNNPPTLNPLNDLILSQDSPAQSVALAGISSGAANEAQGLQITAASSNPALISNPLVFYQSPNVSGALLFKPNAGASGTAIITVTVSDGQAGNSTIAQSFSVTVKPAAAPAPSPNTAPTLNALANVVLAENSSASLNLSGISAGSEAQPLTVTATSSNPGLIPNPAISYASPNTTGTLYLSPAANLSGTAIITVTVNDGQTLNNTVSRSFSVLVNNAPTLNPLSNVSVSQDSPAQNITLSGISSGAAAEADAVVITAISSNPAVIPTPSISYSSPSSTGALTFRPAPGAIGSAVVTVTVNDGQSGNNFVTRSFTATVNAVAPNVAPTLNQPSNIILSQNAGMTIPLTGISSGASTEAQTLAVTAVSSNPALIPNPAVTYGSPNSSGTLAIVPAANVSGTATITVSVSDGQAVNGWTSRSFSVVVNNAPTLDPVNNVTLNQDAPIQSVALTGISSGAASEADSLTVAAVSSNPAVVPAPTVSYSSPSGSGTVSFKPAPGAVGTAVITVSVNDGRAGNNIISRAFLVTVNAVAPNVAPTLNALANLTVASDAPAQAVYLSGISAGGPGESQPLTVTASSSNPSVIPAPAVSYASPNSTGSLVFKPAAGAAGSSVITVTVNDGQSANNTVSRSFAVTVTAPAPNAAPTLSPLGNLTRAQNIGANLLLSGISSGSSTESQTLRVTATSSNPSVVPNPTVSYNSPNSTGTLYIPPSTAPGSAVLTVTVSDGQPQNSTVSRSFTVTVNSPPTLNPIANMSIPVSSSVQTVSLSGISSGPANEGQPVTLTASSSNTGLIPTPLVFYASPNPTGALLFKPVAGLSGTATITVTVRDGQAANGVFSRSFVVTVSGGSVSALSLTRQSTRSEEAGESSEPAAFEVTAEPEIASAAEAAPESEATPASAPSIQISELIVSSSDARSLDFTWQTDLPATCILKYGATPNTEWTSAPSTGLSHTASLRNLQPATTYFVRVVAAGDANNAAVSELSSARTPPVNVLAWTADNAELIEPMYLNYEGGRESSQYVATTEPETGTATFNVEFPEGMSYRVWCRVETPFGDGSFNMSIDGGPEMTGMVRDDGSGQWHWVQLESAGGLLAFLANGGMHQVVFRGGSAGTRLNELCISNDPEWRPVTLASAPRLAATRGKGSTVDLNWVDSWSNTDGYVIESSVDGSEFAQLALASSTARSYRVSEPRALASVYRIASFRGLDQSAPSAVVSVKINPQDPPEAPQSVSATVSPEGQVTITWSDVSSDETGFVIDRSIDQINFETIQVAGANTTSATDTLPGSGYFYYRVYAVNDDAQSAPSENCSVVR